MQIKSVRIRSKCNALRSFPNAYVHKSLVPEKRHTLTRASVLSDTPNSSCILREKALEYESDKAGIERVKYVPDGWSFWSWKGMKVHYAQAGRKGDPVVLLIHGYGASLYHCYIVMEPLCITGKQLHCYGASLYHWRYQFKALSDAGFQVFALDLIGFGLSEKALIDYSNGKPWIDEISSFIQEVIGDSPVTLVGNSLGAYAALAAAAAIPEQIRGIAMLNGAGPLRGVNQPAPDDPSTLGQLKKSILRAVKRVSMYFGFLWAKQPLRIKQVLDLVYAFKDQIDEELVQSIVVPAMDPAASEVFFRVSDMRGEPVYVDDLLAAIQGMPLLLLWGDSDPWMVPDRAFKLKSLYPQADLKLIASGHCPHDDTPALANEELLVWMKGISKSRDGLAEGLQMNRPSLGGALPCPVSSVGQGRDSFAYNAPFYPQSASAVTAALTVASLGVSVSRRNILYTIFLQIQVH
ncbi:hypothetical protein CEUSTIGMA_g8701.t1 [Chlamydomonas eustigma]|uniref:AB hydrolase-1 domain-containing protein n=1 Tax=Chlamydomonas eustigma TaxID=1157962 RepID=A0A250XEC7_9CHLO|nr:hypothetical protein CEUSTIGMA_g8701.t1 [Chlamydomonas eustigma]|eukprot:GAX81269.1 hypothetical protein CEUSTIGMA_g8701.t1 [Chlamydomonas eustigma]